MKASEHATEISVDVILDAYIETGTLKGAAGSLGVSWWTLLRIIKRAGFRGIKDLMCRRGLQYTRKETDRLREVVRLYLMTRNRAEVGRILGISRERVRQLLRCAVRAGLIQESRIVSTVKYRRVPPSWTRERLTRVIARFGLARTARRLRMNPATLRRICTLMGVSSEDIKRMRLEYRRKRAVENYRRFCALLGRPVTTADLRHLPGGPGLSMRICLLFGGMRKFRRNCGEIPDTSTSGDSAGESEP